MGTDATGETAVEKKKVVEEDEKEEGPRLHLHDGQEALSLEKWPLFHASCLLTTVSHCNFIARYEAKMYFWNWSIFLGQYFNIDNNIYLNIFWLV